MYLVIIAPYYIDTYQCPDLARATAVCVNSALHIIYFALPNLAMDNILKLSPFGYAYHKIIFDSQGVPVDYEYIEANEAFGQLTGLDIASLPGKTVRQLLPGIEKAAFNWIAHFAGVATGGGSQTFEQYSDPLSKWYRAHAYSGSYGYFSVLFVDVTDEKVKTQELEAFFNVNLDLLCIADLQGHFLKLNKGWEDLLGFTVQELIGRKFLDFVHPADLQITINTMSVLSDGEQVLNFTNRYRCKDGSYRYIEWRSNLVGDRIYAAARDITEHKKLEAELTHSRDQFSSLVDNIPGITYRCKPCQQWAMLFISSHAETVTGYKAEELIGGSSVPFASIIHSSDIDNVREIIDAAVLSHRSWEVEYRIVRRDGSLRWVYEKGKPILGESGLVLYLDGFILDQTERKQAEQERYVAQAALNQSSVPVVICSPKAEIQYANAAFYNVTGYLDSEVIGRNPRFLKSGLTPDAVYAQLWETVLAGDTWAGELQNRRKDRTLYWEYNTITPIKDESGNIIHLMAVKEDITAKREAVTSLKEAEKELIIAKERFELAVNGSNDGIWDWDIASDKLYLSPQWKAQLGYADSELENKMETFEKLLHHTDKPRVYAYLDRYLKAELNDYCIEFRMMHSDGTYRWIMARGKAILSSAGVPVRMAGSHTDITERRAADELIRKRLQLMEYSAGHSLHELLQKSIDIASEMVESPIGFYHFVHPDQQSLSLQAWSAATVKEFCKAEGQGLHYSIDKAGVWADCVKQKAPVIHNDYMAMPNRKGLPPGHAPVTRELVVPVVRGGKVVSILGVGNKPAAYTQKDVDLVSYISDIAWEIAERKKAEEALLRERWRLESILRGTNVGTWEWNVQTGETVFNQRWADILGYTLEELMPVSIDTWAKLSHPADLANSSNLLQKHFNGHADYYECESRMKHRDGSWVWVLDRGKVATWDSSGKPLLMLGTHQDITMRKEAEAKLAGFARSLEQKNAELDAAATKAQAASKAKSEFLANMSHEIRTPLNGVIGFTDLLISTGLSPAQQQYAHNANVSGKALLAIINDILDFSKIEAGRLDLEIVETNIVELVEQAIDIVKLQAAEKQLELLLSVPPDLPAIISTDPVRLRQVLVNLLSNAVKFTHEGEVELRLAYRPVSQTRISIDFYVRDTGIGISVAQQEYLFKAFMQADSSTTRRYGGTGLGLAISGRLVEKLGGQITVNSNHGQGSTFSFSLQCDYSSYADLPKKPLTVSKVLVIDDKAANREILNANLKHWGISSDMCESGKDAIKLLQNNTYDLVLLDYHMPNLDGMETMRIIRDELQLPPLTLPAILLHSSIETKELKDSCKKLGIMHSIVKPLKASELHYLLMNIKQPLETRYRYQSSQAAPIPAKIRVLIAEDVEMNLLLATAIISQICPNAVIIPAENGRIALELFERSRPDIVLMDIQMPVMDGIESAKAIRNAEALDAAGARVPIIALTAGALIEEQQRALDAGMDSFVTKPVEAERLRKIFRHYFSSETAASHASLDTFDKQSFDTEKLISAIGTNPKFGVKILNSCKTELPRYLHVIESNLPLADYEAIANAAHSIKGIAGNMRMHAMAAYAHETGIKASSLCSSGAASAYAKMEHEWRSLLPVVNKLISKLSKA
jgi:PAS domain S-box-containing protein